MVLTESKAKPLSLINHFTKTIHHNHIDRNKNLNKNKTKEIFNRNLSLNANSNSKYNAVKPI